MIVVSAGNQQSNGNQAINIDYAISNIGDSRSGIDVPRLVDDMADNDGGYTFQLSTSTANGGTDFSANAPALAALRRAFTTWQTEGDYSIYLEGTTNVQTPGRDGVNVVAFESNAYNFDAELGTGTVGIAFNYYGSCGSSEFEVTGMDVLFRRNGNRVQYNFGPQNGSGTDFESVALHELGHTHQLKHVADANELMSFRIQGGITQRSVSPDTRAGAAYVAGIASSYSPPVVRCSGDFNEERNYMSFSAVNGAQLPLDWRYFGAAAGAKQVDLSWGTAREVNAERIVIERAGPELAFTVIGRQRPAGSAELEADYTFTDTAPLNGQNFYRIAQVDFDGAVNYSEVRQVNFGTAALELAVFPNPAVRTLNVRGASAEAGQTLEVFSAAGKLILTVPARADAAVQRIDVSDLPRGQYILRDGRGESVRFVR